MSKNMNILDRRVRAFLVAPVAVVIGILIGPGSVAAIVLYASPRSCSRPVPSAIAPCTP